MDTLLSVSMSLLGQAASSVPKTPPPTAQQPLGNLTNVCATPDSCGASERRRAGERRRSETLDDTPPTPMTNLKLLTNIAASQTVGTRKTLFAPTEGWRVPSLAPEPVPIPAPACGTTSTSSRRAEPPVTPRGDENVPPPGHDQQGTPVKHYHSVFDTPLSQDVARAKRVQGTAKMRWRRRASDLLPLTSVDKTLTVLPPPGGVTVTKSRKDKSLSVLCFRFLKIYPLDVGDKEMSLPLDETALMLGTERRRIYDIVNVLESLHFSVRLEKNRYAWIGQRDLMATLGRLKGLAIHLELPQHLQTALLASDGLASPAGVTLRRGASEPTLSATPSPQLTPRTPCTPLSADSDRLTPHDRGDRTLGVLTQKFVMLLLVSDRPSLSQDVLARVLLGQDGLSPDGHHKAKVRRLYDIANILQSIGLVGKDVSSSRRPVFTYTGPSVDPISVHPCTQRSRHSLIPSTPLSSRPAAALASSNRRAPTTSATPRSATSTPLSGPDAAATPEGTPRAGGLWRPASLDDICQVTALERHRLFEQSIDGSRGKNVLKRRLAEVRRAQAEVKRVRPQPPAGAGQLSPAQHSQLSGLGIKRILIRAEDGTSQEICVREATLAGQDRSGGGGSGGSSSAAGSRLEAALRGAWLTTGPAGTPRPQRALAPRTQKQVVAYQLVPVVRTVTMATRGAEPAQQSPLPVLYDEQTVLSLPEGVCLETAAMTPISLPAATPESLLTPGTMSFIREAVSSGTIKTVCNMSLTPETTPCEQEARGRPARARPAPRASRRLQMD